MNGVRSLIMSKITVQRGRSSRIKRPVFKSKSQMRYAAMRSREFGKEKKLQYISNVFFMLLWQ